MHPGLHSWREDLPSAFVRGLAVFCGLFVLSFIAARVFQPPTAVATGATAPRPDWIEIEKPFPAFALSIPEAADAPAPRSSRPNWAAFAPCSCTA